LIAGEQDPLALLGREAMGNMAGAALPAILTVPITKKALAPSLEGAQADADLAASAEQACTSGMGLADQLDRLAPVSGAGQPSASSEQKASHFFRSTSKAAISAMAFSLRCSSFYSFGEAFG
jgi:hypothetical protein